MKLIPYKPPVKAGFLIRVLRWMARGWRSRTDHVARIDMLICTRCNRTKEDCEIGISSICDIRAHLLMSLGYNPKHYGTRIFMP